MKPISICSKANMWYQRVYPIIPIWYAAAPNVVNTFCKGYDWSGKKVFAFATSGGSGIGKTAEKLEPYVTGAATVQAKLVQSADDLNQWSKEVLG